MKATDRLLSAPEVATILDCSKQRIYQMVRDQIIPAVRLGRSVRFQAAVLDNWLNDGGRAHPGGWRRIPREP